MPCFPGMVRHSGSPEPTNASSPLELHWHPVHGTMLAPYTNERHYGALIRARLYFSLTFRVHLLQVSILQCIGDLRSVFSFPLKNPGQRSWIFSF